MAALIPDVTDRAGTHVLVIGVSAYLHFQGGADPTPKGRKFEMKQLSAAARSASEFAEWMLKHYRNPAAPLASLRVLLSPVAGEGIAPDIAALVAARPANETAATLANAEADLVAFQALCDKRKDNVVVVYAAGHGVQLTKHGAIVLLHDCGDETDNTELKRSIDLSGCHAGFDNSETAQTQFWFVDACRQEPAMAERYETMRAGLTLDTKPGQARCNPVFMSTSTQAVAYARIGGQTLFNEALMKGLAGALAKPPDLRVDGVPDWHIVVGQLTSHLPSQVEALARAARVEQLVVVGGNPNEALFHVFDGPPRIAVDIQVMPDALKAVAVGSLSHRMLGQILDANCAWPMQGTVDAGIYELSVDINDPAKKFFKYVSIEPPEFEMQVNLP